MEEMHRKHTEKRRKKGDPQKTHSFILPQP
jgi:hypothetical protein